MSRYLFLTLAVSSIVLCASVPEDGEAFLELDVYDFKGPGVALAMYNVDELHFLVALNCRKTSHVFGHRIRGVSSGLCCRQEFCKIYCPYCVLVKQLLTQLKASYKAIELDAESDGSEVQPALVSGMGWAKDC